MDVLAVSYFLLVGEFLHAFGYINLQGEQWGFVLGVARPDVLLLLESLFTPCSLLLTVGEVGDEDDEEDGERLRKGIWRRRHSPGVINGSGE